MSTEKSVGCSGLTAGDSDHKVYSKEPHSGSHNPESHFLAIRVGSNKTPADYVKAKNAKVAAIGSSAEDPDDAQTGNTWNWYIVYCPNGPPCI